MILMPREEFTAHRRAAQDQAIERLLPTITDALRHYGEEGWWRSLLAPVHSLFNETLAGDSGGDVRHDVRAWAALAKVINETLAQTSTPTKATAQTLATWLSTAAINAAAVSAADHDSEALVLAWVTMHDQDVRTSHRHTDGQTRPPGEKFDVDGVKMSQPGDTSAPIEFWINCRCMLRPALATETAALSDAGARSDGPAVHRVVVALPSETDPVHGLGPEAKHMTLVYLGKPDDNPDLDMASIHQQVSEVAAGLVPFTAQVTGVDNLGDDGAKVWMLHPDVPTSVHEALKASGPLADAFSAVEQYPKFTPHVTIGYNLDDRPDPSLVAGAEGTKEIAFDRLAVWDGEDRQEYALGGDMPQDQAQPDQGDSIGLDQPLAWHGVLAPEGVWSGDGRQFAANSLRFRDLPLPLTWQKTSMPGHDGSVTVAKIEQIARVDGQMRAQGHWLALPEADEAVGLVAEFGKFGVSVDADDSEFEFDEATEKVTFTSARIASASMVAIPAFAEAYIALGPAPEGFMPGADAPADPADDCDPSDPNYEQCLADAAKAKAPADTSAALVTAGRGPGWITDPVPTKRIHDYWTVPGQPGYEKIGWGTDGDFDRCRVEIGQEIAEKDPATVARYMNQICAQWHHDATGFWPGHAPAETSLKVPEGDPAPALTLVASVGTVAKAEWFEQPDLEGVTPLTITEEGRVFGHLADWQSCHAGYPGTCVAPPHSPTNYARFLTGEVMTDKGPIAAGRISLGGGHAGGGLRPNAALAHYDSTSTVVARVNCGEDEWGIWLAGDIMPGTPPETVDMLRLSPLSGDWRTFGNEYDLIATLAVNAPGYLLPRVGISNARQVSLVAAGVVEPHKPVESFDLDAIAERVVARLDQRAANRKRMLALAAKVAGSE